MTEFSVFNALGEVRSDFTDEEIAAVSSETMRRCSSLPGACPFCWRARSRTPSIPFRRARPGNGARLSPAYSQMLVRHRPYWQGHGVGDNSAGLFVQAEETGIAVGSRSLSEQDAVATHVAKVEVRARQLAVTIMAIEPTFADLIDPDSFFENEIVSDGEQFR